MTERPDVYLIGIQEGKHPGGGRFTAFRHYLNAPFVDSPLKVRFFPTGWKTWLDWALGTLTPRPLYSVGLLVMELSAGLHMLRHRAAVYHSVKGEVDLHLLPLLSQLTGTHLVATFHDGPQKLGYWKVDRICGRLAGVVLLAQSQRSYFEPLLPPDRIFHVPHGVNTDLFRPADELSREPVVTAAGSYFRDFETLAKVLLLVWEQNPRVHFLLIGTRQADGWNPAPRIDDPRVEYIDGITDDQLRSTYQRAALAVVPVIDATANNALLEGMACGLPVVATDVGGIHEYLGDEAGVLCPPRDSQAMANAIVGVLGDRAAATRMGRAGRARAVQKYDYQVVADQLRAVYARVRELGAARPAGVGVTP